MLGLDRNPLCIRCGIWNIEFVSTPQPDDMNPPRTRVQLRVDQDRLLGRPSEPFLGHHRGQQPIHGPIELAEDAAVGSVALEEAHSQKVGDYFLYWPVMDGKLHWRPLGAGPASSYVHG